MNQLTKQLEVEILVCHTLVTFPSLFNKFLILFQEIEKMFSDRMDILINHNRQLGSSMLVYLLCYGISD